MHSVRGQSGAQFVSTRGPRALAGLADPHAVADASGDNVFMYFNLRRVHPRGPAAYPVIGRALSAVIRAPLGLLRVGRPMGLRLQNGEGHTVFDAKRGKLHPWFART